MDDLFEQLSKELNLPVPPGVRAMAEAIRLRHGEAGQAVLFYGSRLRQPEDRLGDALLDFYLLVDRYSKAYRKSWLAIANTLLPPNAFYAEIPWESGRLRAKYVVISLEDFAKGCGRAARNVSIWARFSQPARLVWHRDADTERRVTAACADAVRTMLRRVWPLEPETRDAAKLWIRALRETYASELRPESAGRAEHIFDVDRQRYEQLTAAVLAEIGRPETSIAQALAAWRRRRWIGKSLNAARILKAAFTFDGGLDYALWKIRRHSGVTVPVTDWQRRHPFLAAPGLAWRLYRLGAFK